MSLRGKKIFLIEDDANLLYGLQAKFRVAGFETVVDEGSAKTEIMAGIKALKPDYVILDILLPGVNGFDLLAEIKADAAISKIPVFVFTNLSDDDSRRQGEKLGADFYLIKTDFSLDEFIAKFIKIITNKEKLHENIQK